MELKDIIVLATSTSVAVLGWAVAHWLSTRRELEQKKREFRVKHLREAYLKIANLCDRGELPRDLADLQDALNDIQLFGDERQIRLIGSVVERMSAQQPADFNELLKQLRNEIRGHIGLAPLASTRWHIRSRKKAVGDPGEQGAPTALPLSSRPADRDDLPALPPALAEPRSAPPTESP